ncbi:MAG: hypothetical protein V7K86_28920 [Nostoc sp.]|uniref:hypothetical protein n=1 Tax=Nostoc sp. TaxID=1180 RepID=UPI002FF7A5EE
MPNTTLGEAAPTATLGDATRSLLPRRGTLSTSAQCPMPFYEQTVNIELKNSKLALIINSLGLKLIADSL